MKKLLLFLFLLTAAIAARAAVNGSVNFTDQDLIISVDDSAEEPIAVYPNAVQTVYGEDNVTFAAGSKVKLIEKGNVIFDNTTKSSAKALRSPHALPSTLEEGRTFWYYQKEFWNPDNHFEYGITIGQDTVIGDAVWKKLYICKGGAFTGETPKEIAKMDYRQYEVKEDGNTLSVRIAPLNLSCTNQYDWGVFSLLNDPEFEEYYYYNGLKEMEPYVFEFNIFKFGDVGDTFIYGNDRFRLYWTIQSIEPIEINGKTYEKYRAILSDQNDWVNIYWKIKCPYEYIKGLGFTAGYEDLDLGLSQLFYLPLGYHYVSTPIYDPPVLRYITDADDSILYEGEGGLRLWELDPMGIDSVTIDSSRTIGQDEWYTLQGVRVPAPSTPGIYIRVSGNRSEKVRIR